MALSNQEKYDRLFDAAKKMGLSNNDLAILLQVTPAMVSRYRHDASRIGRRSKDDKLGRAAKALRVIRSTTGVKAIREMSPQERASCCVSALKEVDPDKAFKMPIMI